MTPTRIAFAGAAFFALMGLVFLLHGAAWGLAGGALLILAVSILTAVRVPAAVNWRVAVVVSELGYALILVPLAVGGVAWTGYTQAPILTWITLAACSGARNAPAI